MFKGHVNMRFSAFALALALLVPSAASAGPISIGTWSQIGGSVNPDSQSLESLSFTPFWDHNSWDGPGLNGGTLIKNSDLSNCAECPAIEYLHNGLGGYVPFQFTGDIFNQTKIFGITAWGNGNLTRVNDAFVYDNGAGNVYNSVDNPGQFALFRVVGADSIRYFLGIEDIILTAQYNDLDYNDYGLTFTTQPVPEPGTLLLLGSGVAAMAARRKLSGRKV